MIYKFLRFTRDTTHGYISVVLIEIIEIMRINTAL